MSAEGTSVQPPSVADGPAGVSRELTAAIVRVWSTQKGVVGSGFLADESHVITCAHVVTTALGLATGSRPEDPDVVTLDFPLVAPNQTVRARVEMWRPIEDDETGDIAVLSLLDEAPAGLAPARLVSGRDFWGHPFRTFGYPPHRDHGVWVAGVLRGVQGIGWIQMEGVASGYAVEGGFSGGPVWDDELAGVVGMTVAAESATGIRTAYLMPVEALMRAWPPMAQQTLAPCPYRGLYAFRAQDASVFYGRKDLIERVVRQVPSQPVLALVGPSGSGKSSVLHAGLLPHLEQRPDWKVLAMRPAQAPSPLLSMASAFLDVLEPELSEVGRLETLDHLSTLIAAGHLPEIVDRVISREKVSHLVVAIDQFEELFVRDATEVSQFSEILTSALRADRSARRSLHVVLTLRADFLNSALHQPALAAVLEDSVVTIGQMEPEQLHSVIEGPLPATVRYEAGLVDRILGDLGHDSGNLPLLQFALTLLWEHQERGILTHQGYEALGGVNGALASYAESVYSEQLLPRDRDQARRLFVQLARPSEFGTPVRRVARPEELGDRRWQLAQRLAATRLLVADRDRTGVESIEMAHEALITGWKRLHDWIEEDRAFRLWQEQLRTALRAWERAGGDSGALLRGAPLAEAERWLAERQEDLGGPEREFIQLGAKMQGRSTRRLRVAVMTLALLLLTATTLGGVVIVQDRRSAAQTMLVGSRDLANQADAMAADDPRTALLLAASAYRMQPSPESIRTLTTLATEYHQIDKLLEPELPPIRHVVWSPGDPDLLAIQGSNYVALWDVKRESVRAVKTFSGGVSHVVFDSGGTLLAVAHTGDSGRGAVSLWRPNVNQVVTLFETQTEDAEDVKGLKISRDGQLVGLCRLGRVELRNASSGALASVTPPADSANAPGCGIGFDHHDNLIYVSQGAVVSWDPRTSEIVAQDALPTLREEEVDSERSPTIAVAPDGRTAVVIDLDGRVLLWRLDRHRAERPDLPEVLTEDTATVRFAVDSGRAVIGLGSGFYTVKMNGEHSSGFYKLPESGDRQAPAMSPNGETVAVLVSPGAIALLELSSHPGIPVETEQLAAWSAEEDRAAILTGNGVAVYHIKRGDPFTIDRRLDMDPPPDSWEHLWLSPSGRHVAGQIDSAERSLTLFEVENIASSGRELLHDSTITAYGFDAGGQFLVSADAAKIVVRSADDLHIERIVPTDGGATINQVAVSPDGRFVAAIDSTEKVTLWDDSGTPTALTVEGASSITFSPNETWLSVGTQRGIEFWDTISKQWRSEMISLLVQDDEPKPKFSPDGRFLAASAQDIRGGSRAYVWDVADLRLVGAFFYSNNFALLADEGLVLAVRDGGVNFFSYDTENALDFACRVTSNGNLSVQEWTDRAPGFPYTQSCP